MIRKSFGRSLSFPLPTSKQQLPKLKGVGSTTLPSRFNPSLSDLHHHLHSLLTWHHHDHHHSTVSILDGLSHLHHLHSSLRDLLPSLDPLRLRRPSTWPTLALDDFLRFADAYSSLRSALIALQHSHSATSSAIRRNDETRIAASLHSQRKAEKELLKIISSAIKSVGKWGPTNYDSDVAALMREVVLATAMATAAVVAGIAEMSAGAVGGVTSALGNSCIMKLATRKKEGEEKWRESALEKMEELEGCMAEVEKRFEGLFRSLVNTRVFLLNILTPYI